MSCEQNKVQVTYTGYCHRRFNTREQAAKELDESGWAKVRALGVFSLIERDTQECCSITLCLTESTSKTLNFSVTYRNECDESIVFAVPIGPNKSPVHCARCLRFVDLRTGEKLVDDPLMRSFFCPRRYDTTLLEAGNTASFEHQANIFENSVTTHFVERRFIPGEHNITLPLGMVSWFLIQSSGKPLEKHLAFPNQIRALDVT